MGEKLSETREKLDESKETTGEARRQQEKQGDPREKVESAKRAKTQGGESGSRSTPQLARSQNQVKRSKS